MRKYGFLFASLLTGLSAQTPAWKFAVSGDSRNCGDIVMPAIAAGVLESQAQFYWHLGDFRAIYTFDEDLVPPASLHLATKPLNIIDYETGAWPDFIAHQLGPFGSLPIFLSPGNHETIPPATRDGYLTQFADWLEAPAIRNQRLRDDPQDHTLRTYYHWIDHSDEVRGIVVGMHAALPGSFGNAHSMSDWAQGENSGREVYQALLHAQDAAHKHVYLLASHSHFYMEDVYRTDIWKGQVLPGWIIGTAGAVRYRLPAGAAPGGKAMTDVYGYLIGAAASDGSIDFSFQKLSVADLLRANKGRLPESLVHWCDEENKQ
jgi:hypothetical protein